MAEAIVSLLVQQLQALIGESSKLFVELAKDIEFVKGELERMMTFLTQADIEEDNKDNDEELERLVGQIRDVVYDTQDVVDECNLIFSSPHRHGCLWQVIATVKSLRARQTLASELKRIRNKIEDISKGHNRYREYKSQLRTAIRPAAEVRNLTAVDGRDAALLQDDADLVGIDKQKDYIKSLMLGGDSQLQVISVVGMPGSGKTTLVRKVYEEVLNQFKRHAWVSVNISPDIKELLKNIVVQLCDQCKQEVPTRLQSMGINELKALIKEWFRTSKPYIVVFDDVWERKIWDDLQNILPKTDDIGKSCVLLTTRNNEVGADQVVYEMKPLSGEDSRTLFFKRVFKDGNCPEHLKEISTKVLEKCGTSCPYAILAVARIFAPLDKTLEDWNAMFGRIPRELEVDGKLDRVRNLLLLSFYQLPHRQKLCLLYLSIFPDYKKINCMEVIRLWIAEGLLEDDEKLTREEVGNNYLGELINRNLLQVVERRLDRKPKACGIEGMLCDIIVSKSKKVKLVTIAGEKGTVQKSWPEKVRRLAIHGPLEEDTIDINKFKQLRSLVLFSPEDIPRPELLSKMLSDGSRLVKVLDLKGASLDTIPEEVFKLHLLEYLSLRSTKVKVVPKSIGKLWNLQTLDLKDTFVVQLPNQILKLKKLRHLLVYRYEDVNVHDGVQSFSAPYKIGSLVSLQKLSYIEADERKGVKIVTEIGKLRQLRRLGITKLRREDGKDLCSSIEKLVNLRSLFIVAREADEIIDVQGLTAVPPFLRTLTLRGRLEKVPQWISSLHDLNKVALLECKLKDEPLKYFEDLQNLAELCLFRAYEGEEMNFEAGTFPCLKRLILASLSGLKRIRIGKGSMPCLNELIIIDSKLMEKPPSGIENLSNLQLVQLVNMAESLVTSLKHKECKAKIYAGAWEEDTKAARKLQNVRFFDLLKAINDPSLKSQS